MHTHVIMLQVPGPHKLSVFFFTRVIYISIGVDGYAMAGMAYSAAKVPSS